LKSALQLQEEEEEEGKREIGKVSKFNKQISNATMPHTPRFSAIQETNRILRPADPGSSDIPTQDSWGKPTQFYTGKIIFEQ
jgi:hypothetical protein